MWVRAAWWNVRRSGVTSSMIVLSDSLPVNHVSVITKAWKFISLTIYILSSYLFTTNWEFMSPMFKGFWCDWIISKETRLFALNPVRSWCLSRHGHLVPYGKVELPFLECQQIQYSYRWNSSGLTSFWQLTKSLRE